MSSKKTTTAKAATTKKAAPKKAATKKAAAPATEKATVKKAAATPKANATAPAAKISKVTNLERLDFILTATNTKDPLYTQYVEHLRRVLMPVVKGDTIKPIIALHRKGLSNQEIVQAGFNKSTVSRQVREYKTRRTLAIDIAIADEDGEELDEE